MADSSAHDRPSMAEKTVTILAELAATPEPLTLSQLMRRTGFAKTTTHRLLSELLSDGLVRRGDGRYRLNTAVSWLAAPIDERIYRVRRLRSRLLPHLIDLYEKTHQTVNLGALYCDEVVYVERIYGHNRVHSRSDGTDRAPAHLTAAGRLLLAYEPSPHSHLPDQALRPGDAHPEPVHDLEVELSCIRRDGVAFSFGDLTHGVHCVAAPVRDRAGRPIAAVALAGPGRVLDPERFAPVLRRTAHAMSVAARGAARQKSVRRHRRSAL